MSAELLRQVRELSNRVAALEAERGIIRTIQRYAFAIDDGLDLQWVNCFTPDGVFEVRTRLDVSIRVQGHDASAAFIARHTKAPSRWHKHVTTSHLVQVAGIEATAQSYVIRVDSDDDEVPKVWVFGRYLDDLVRDEHGTWRFRHRIISLEGVHPIQGGLLRAGAP